MQADAEKIKAVRMGKKMLKLDGGEIFLGACPSYYCHHKCALNCKISRISLAIQTSNFKVIETSDT